MEVPDNEFTNDIEAMPSSDTMYHSYLARYTNLVCIGCGTDVHWIRNDRIGDMDLASYVCPKCARG